MEHEHDLFWYYMRVWGGYPHAALPMPFVFNGPLRRLRRALVRFEQGPWHCGLRPGTPPRTPLKRWLAIRGRVIGRRD